MELTESILSMYHKYKDRVVDDMDDITYTKYRILCGDHIYVGVLSKYAIHLDNAIYTSGFYNTEYAKFILSIPHQTDMRLYKIAEDCLLRNDLIKTNSYDLAYIWYPNQPSESTCKYIAKRHPYRVGRICAVKGYTELYKTLNILPEVNILEEARQAGNDEIVKIITDNTKNLWFFPFDVRNYYKPIRRANECDIHNAKYNTIKYIPTLHNTDKVNITSLNIQNDDIIEVMSTHGPVHTILQKHIIDAKLQRICDMLRQIDNK